jgi:hypothetical protein
MSRALLGSIAGLVVGAGCVFGQAPPAPTPPDAAPATSPPATPAPAAQPDPSAPPLAPPPGLLDGPKPPIHDAGPADLNYWSFTGEYLLWWIRSTRFITPASRTDDFGLTSPLFTSSRISYKNYPLSGGRFSLGYFMKDDVPGLPMGRPYDLGFEANIFSMGKQSINFSNDTAPLIARPFFDLNNRRESAQLVGARNIATGLIAVGNTFDFWGAEANMWKNLFYDFPLIATRVDFVAGLRYFDLSEDFRFQSTSVFFPTQPVGSPFVFLAGNRLDVIDYFFTRNQFIGPQVGLLYKFYMGEVDLNVGTKVAVGWNNAEINIAGAQVRTPPGGAPVRSTGGLLALPTNIGTHHDNVISFIPELDLSASVQLTKHINATVGYSFILMTRAFRPGYQIDRVIDITQIPNFPTGGAMPTGLRRPAVPFDDTYVWFQGLNLALNITW